MELLRTVCVLALGLSLAGCTTDSSFSDLLSAKNTTPAAPSSPAAASSGLEANALAADDLPAGKAGVAAARPGLLGSEPYDDLSIGKRYFRVGNYGMAERYFRHAVETHPRDAESWLGLAAAYDRLRRFDLADRAYAEATKLAGPTVEILNNEGYSYMLRGDYARARAKLDRARRLDPDNRFVQNNLALLVASAHKAKAIE
jgi:Flp pilus assembly protein TadD